MASEDIRLLEASPTAAENDVQQYDATLSPMGNGLPTEVTSGTPHYVQMDEGGSRLHINNQRVKVCFWLLC